MSTPTPPPGEPGKPAAPAAAPSSPAPEKTKEQIQAEREAKELEALKQQILDAAKEIYAAKLVEFGEGNVSMRVRKKEEILITPTQNDYATMTKDDIAHMQFDGKQLNRSRPASSEYRLHVAIYKARPKVTCIIHTHSHYGSMLAMVGKKIPVLVEEQVTFLGGEVNVAQFGASGTEDLGAKALEAMGDTNAVILTNHGTLVCGKDVKLTVKAANLVEKMAKIYWGALQLGDVSIIPRDKLDKFYEMFDMIAATYAKKPAPVASKPTVPDTNPK